MANYMDYSNAQQFAQAIRTAMNAYNGAWKARGSVTFANLPSTLTLAMDGYVYNVSDEFTTDSRFVEGAGIVCAAGTNVAVVNVGTEQVPDMKFDTLGTFIDTSAIDARIDAVLADIAPEFAAANAYSIGDVVTHEDQLYKFKAAHTAGDAWDASEVDAVDVLDLIDDASDDLVDKINEVRSDLAPAFDSTQAYSIGDVVTYGYQTYKFKAAHTAGSAWSSSEVDAVTVVDLINAAEPDSLTSAQMTALIAIIDGTSSGT